MRKFWRDIVNFFLAALGAEPVLVPIRSTAHAQMQRRLRQLRQR
ncbi:hypothetical protein [Rhodoplanes sp. Z2-YC6860]|nr:hypothetical protein [Rhodoplanes sp. Z2-YC6860]